MAKSQSDTGPKIVTGYRPGAISCIAALHIDCYSTEFDFDLPFEAKVAREVSEFFSRHDESTDHVWLVLLDGNIHGSMVIDGGEPGASEKGAHLRWFILSDTLRGNGLGKMLMEKAMAFCHERGFSHVYLTTFDGLPAARTLYEQFGFQLKDEKTNATWGREMHEQLFVWTPGDSGAEAA